MSALSYMLAKLFGTKTLSLAVCQSVVNRGLAGLSHTARSDGGIFAELTITVTVASVDTRPQGGDAAETAAPFTSGAVPSEETGDAQNPSKSTPSESPPMTISEQAREANEALRLAEERVQKALRARDAADAELTAARKALMEADRAATRIQIIQEQQL